jgi:hypothetical protein
MKRPIEANDFIREALEFTATFDNKLRTWACAADMSAEERQALVRGIHQCAKRADALGAELGHVSVRCQSGANSRSVHALSH